MPETRAFLDTNVLVYAHDKDSSAKRSRCRDLIETLGESGTGVISTQVMQEYYVAVTRKLSVPPLTAKGLLKAFHVFEIVRVSPDLIDDAIDCSILNRLSFWDSLLLAAASAAGCTLLYSEDLNPGQTIMGVRVENPFA